MSVLTCGACSKSIDTDFKEAFEVQDEANMAVNHYCQDCLLIRAGKLADGAIDPFLINGEPAAEWVSREIGW